MSENYRITKVTDFKGWDYLLRILMSSARVCSHITVLFNLPVAFRNTIVGV